jgi:hypothetical protein
MLAEIIGHNPGNSIGRPTSSAGGDNRNGASGIGLCPYSGGSKHPSPDSQDLATLHGFLLLWLGGFCRRPMASLILAGESFGAKGASYRKLTRIDLCGSFFF